MMPRRTVDELTGTPLNLVYIAGNVTEAEEAERCLTDAGVDYALSLEPFTTPFRRVLGWEYTGLFFYVPTPQHPFAQRLLEGRGLGDTVPLEQEDH